MINHREEKEKQAATTQKKNNLPEFFFQFSRAPKSDLADLPKNTKLHLGELSKCHNPFIQLTITRLNEI